MRRHSAPTKAITEQDSASTAVYRINEKDISIVVKADIIIVGLQAGVWDAQQNHDLAPMLRVIHAVAWLGPHLRTSNDHRFIVGVP